VDIDKVSYFDYASAAEQRADQSFFMTTAQLQWKGLLELYAQTVVRADYYASEELFSDSHQVAQFNKDSTPSLR
jgi:hypothetical protein